MRVWNAVTNITRQVKCSSNGTVMSCALCVHVVDGKCWVDWTVFRDSIHSQIRHYLVQPSAQYFTQVLSRRLDKMLFSLMVQCVNLLKTLEFVPIVPSTTFTHKTNLYRVYPWWCLTTLIIPKMVIFLQLVAFLVKFLGSDWLPACQAACACLDRRVPAGPVGE